jgi:hypothetical protein
MPLVVLTKGRVTYVDECKPRIGSRVRENPIMQKRKQYMDINQLSECMYRLQTSLLKGKK